MCPWRTRYPLSKARVPTTGGPEERIYFFLVKALWSPHLFWIRFWKMQRPPTLAPPCFGPSSQLWRQYGQSFYLEFLNQIIICLSLSHSLALSLSLCIMCIHVYIYIYIYMYVSDLERALHETPARHVRGGTAPDRARPEVPGSLRNVADWWCAGVGSLPSVSRSRTQIRNFPVIDWNLSCRLFMFPPDNNTLRICTSMSGEKSLPCFASSPDSYLNVEITTRNILKLSVFLFVGMSMLI